MYVILSTLRTKKERKTQEQPRDKREISPKIKWKKKQGSAINKLKNLNKFKNKFETFQRLRCVSLKAEQHETRDKGVPQIFLFCCNFSPITAAILQ